MDRLGFRRESVHWSLLPEYRSHKWDGDPDPLLKICAHVGASEWVAVESGISTGKTYLLAGLTLGFLESWPGSRVVTIAPKGDQLRLHIWSEIAMLWPKFGLGELQTTELKMQPPGSYWVATAFTAGVSTTEVGMSAQRAHGFHRKDQLIIFEDTPGIHDSVISAFEEAATAPHNIVVAVGNPNSQTDSLHQLTKRKRFHKVRISGLDHPNVVLKRSEFVPGAQTEQGLADLLDKYGSESHPMFLSRARGICPSSHPDALIQWEWCERAARREIRTALEGPAALGVDVAHSERGNKAAIAEGLGSACLSVKSQPCADVLIFGAKVSRRAREIGAAAHNVGVDGTGVGAGTIDRLAEDGLDVVNTTKGGVLERLPWQDRRMTEEFDGLRSQQWWQMMLDLKHGDESRIVLPYDPELFTDLCAPKWRTKGNKIAVESKEDVKKRLGRSTDKGDAAVYWNWVRRLSANYQTADGYSSVLDFRSL